MRHFFIKKYKIFVAILLVITFAIIFNNANVNEKNEYIYANTPVDNYVYAGGYPVGIYIKYDGILVVKVSEFKDNKGINITPLKGVLKCGDIIYEVDGRKVSSKEEFNNIILNSGNKDVELLVKRNGEKLKIKVRPKECIDGMYKLGIWIRDDMQGIGTMTYVTKDRIFGALGHGINDSDTNNIAYISSGKLYDAKILGIKKGVSGTAGELLGAINYNKKYEIGEITKNSAIGIYGKLYKEEYFTDDNLYKVCDKYNIKKGEASLISYVSGVKKEYKIEITELDYDASNVNKGIKFVVKDEDLIDITGGIVRGMSGSPIIQDGQIVGAVTHVLINDPKSGYGIFIDSMIK